MKKMLVKCINANCKHFDKVQPVEEIMFAGHITFYPKHGLCECGWDVFVYPEEVEN